MTTQIAEIATLLREYGQAVRGDWADLDGRSVRYVLDEIADQLDGASIWTDLVTERRSIAICPSGLGHWQRYCTQGCEAPS